MARDFGRWFRFYDAVLDDPKVQRLSDPLFRAWVNLMCLASRGGGQFSDNLDEIGFALRVSPAQASKLIEGLTKAGLLEHIDERFEPHNWNERQFKSDVSNERVKRFRERSKAAACNGDETLHARYKKRPETVSETPPEAETDTEADQKQIRAEGERASAPRPEPPPILNLPQRKRWPVDAVVPEPWIAKAAGERQRLGLAPIDLQVVATKFSGHYGAEGNARTLTEWEAKWIKFVLTENVGKSNGSPAGGQHGQPSRVTRIVGEFIAESRARSEADSG